MSATVCPGRHSVRGRPVQHGITFAFGWPRCTVCGHRVRWDGWRPVETRKMPPWRWPGELRNRSRARKIGRMEHS